MPGNHSSSRRTHHTTVKPASPWDRMDPVEKQLTLDLWSTVRAAANERDPDMAGSLERDYNPQKVVKIFHDPDTPTRIVLEQADGYQEIIDPKFSKRLIVHTPDGNFYSLGGQETAPVASESTSSASSPSLTAPPWSLSIATFLFVVIPLLVMISHSMIRARQGTRRVSYSPPAPPPEPLPKPAPVPEPEPEPKPEPPPKPAPPVYEPMDDAFRRSMEFARAVQQVTKAREVRAAGDDPPWEALAQSIERQLKEKEYDPALCTQVARKSQELARRSLQYDKETAP